MNQDETQPEEPQEPAESYAEITKPPADGSILFSGMQPTGELHLGNYLGAVKNWSKLQSRYHSIFCIVDLHALTVQYDPQEMPRRIFDMAVGILACGVDPNQATLFAQSQVLEHAHLGWILGTVAPLGDLERMTQFKEKSDQHKKNTNSGLFTYPVLQSADIVLYKARGVPVGQDQVQHIELCRSIARKFNNRYGEVFPLPAALLSPTPKIIGLDGESKMSKSKGNTIVLSDSAANIWEKLKVAKTDTARMRRKDPGNPENCNIGSLHKIFSSDEKIEEVRVGCTTAGIGCFDCKKWLHENMMQELAPIQEKEQQLRQHPDEVRDILQAGAVKCRAIAAKTLDEVNQKLGLPAHRFSV
jgi:tryptophanyl-tRNA synthetase